MLRLVLQVAGGRRGNTIVLLRRGDIDSMHMSERYTEKARRVIFFARYEASNYGSPYIESEHVLLGLLREDHALANRLGNRRIVEPEIRAEIETRITRLRTVLNISGGTPFGRMRERFEVR